MSDEPIFHNIQLVTDPRTGVVKGMTIQLSYGLTEAEATILLRPDQAIPSTDDSIREEILRLGEAILTAANSPLSVSSHHPARK
jgi:hypothetical protein